MRERRKRRNGERERLVKANIFFTHVEHFEKERGSEMDRASLEVVEERGGWGKDHLQR